MINRTFINNTCPSVSSSVKHGIWLWLTLDRLRMIGKATATGLTTLAFVALIDVCKAEADTLDWRTSTPPTDIVSDWSPYGGQSVNLPSGNVYITQDSTGQPMPYMLSWSIIYVGDFQGGQAEVGIMNGTGSSGSGFFSTPGPVFGLPDISTLFVNSGNYIGVVDLNGNGKFGTYDTETGTFIPEAYEAMTSVVICYSDGHFNVTGTYFDPVSETVTVNFVGIGETAAFSGGSNLITLIVCATNVTTFSIQYKAAVTAASWTALGTYDATGTVTAVTDTNAAPVRFYRAVAP